MRKGQIWVETVIYTLIGLSIMGIVLGIVKPALDEKKDSISINQNIDLLNSIDDRINEIKYTSGNSREVSAKIGRGKMIIDGINDAVSIIVEDSSYEYSQQGQWLNAGGKVNALTTEKGSKFSVLLYMNYTSQFNITYRGTDSEHVIQPSSSEYNLGVINRGKIGEMINIDFF